LKSARSVCRFWIVSGWLLAGVAFGAHAEEPKERVTKPASSAANPAPTAASSRDAGKAAPDEGSDEFLEFLGSVDTDAADEDWLDYLAQTDILKIAKVKKKAQAAESKPAPDKAGK
jgi:hypothetical protein